MKEKQKINLSLLPFHAIIFAIIAINSVLSLPAVVKSIITMLKISEAFSIIRFITHIFSILSDVSFVLIAVFLFKNKGERCQKFNRLFIPFLILNICDVVLYLSILISALRSGMGITIYFFEILTSLLRYLILIGLSCILIRSYHEFPKAYNQPNPAYLVAGLYFIVSRIVVWISCAAVRASIITTLQVALKNLLIPALWLLHFYPGTEQAQPLQQSLKAIKPLVKLLLFIILIVILLTIALNYITKPKSVGYYYDANGNGQEDAGEYAYTEHPDGSTDWDVTGDGKVDLHIGEDGVSKI